jgi:hypothetical protein
MEQIDGHRVSLSRRIARGIAHGLISYHQSHEMISPFAISATGTSKDKGSLSSTAFRIPETRNAKCKSHPGAFRYFGYRDVKRQRVIPPLHRESPKPETRNVKAAQEPFRHFGYRDSRDKGVFLHCIGNPRNPKCEKRPKAISAFRLPGLQRDKGSLFHCIGNPETRNAKCKSAQKPFRHFGYRDFKRQRGRSSTASGIPETRNAKCKSRPGAISAFRLPGLQRQRGVPPLHRESPKPETRNVKAPKSHFGISATGTSKTKGSLLHCIGNPRNPKREM